MEVGEPAQDGRQQKKQAPTPLKRPQREKKPNRRYQDYAFTIANDYPDNSDVPPNMISFSCLNSMTQGEDVGTAI